jgi:RNA polymerase sigma-70 factor, ECF subfamily
MTQADVAEPRVPLAMTRTRPLAAPSARVRTVVDAEYDLLWRAIRRLGVPEGSVEDAAQQVLIIFARRIDDVEPGSERSFLLGTAVRVAWEFRKKDARSIEFVEQDAIDEHASDTPDPEQLLDARRARELLDEALARLPMDQRAVFVLIEFEEMTMAEVATALSVPPGTVASRLRRAREAFASIVQQLGAREGRRTTR